MIKNNLLNIFIIDKQYIDHSIEHLSIDWRYRVGLRVFAGAFVCVTPYFVESYAAVGGLIASTLVLVLIIGLRGNFIILIIINCQ